MTAAVAQDTPLRDFAEAAAYLHVGVHHLRKAVAARTYPHTRIGRKVLFSQQDLDRIVAMNAVEPRPSGAAIRLAHSSSRGARRTGT